MVRRQSRKRKMEGGGVAKQAVSSSSRSRKMEGEGSQNKQFPAAVEDIQMSKKEQQKYEKKKEKKERKMSELKLRKQKRESRCPTVLGVLHLSDAAVGGGPLVVVLGEGQGPDAGPRRALAAGRL